MSRYQKGKTNLDFTEARDIWAVRKSAPRSRQITTPAPHHSVFFTGRMPFLPPSQQRQSTEGTSMKICRIKQTRLNMPSQPCRWGTARSARLLDRSRDGQETSRGGRHLAAGQPGELVSLNRITSHPANQPSTPPPPLL